MSGYVIGSSKGKKIADGLKSGQSYKASDGSTWTKNKDGSVSVRTKQGGYTQNAYTSPSTSTPSPSKPSAGGGSGKSRRSNVVNTNTSYGGQFLSVDLNKDYQAEINKAKANGDYAAASQNEALRNAKINYLNSQGLNSAGHSVTNEYVKAYDKSVGSGGRGTNNRGGAVYENKASSISDLENNWTRANINGAIYSRDKSGNIYQDVGRSNGEVTKQLVGNGYNKATNEFTYSSVEDARKEAYNRYIMSGAFKDLGVNANEGVHEYIRQNGLVDEGYVNVVQTGDARSYNKRQIEEARIKNEEIKRQKQMQSAEIIKRFGSGENSFETDIIDKPKKDNVLPNVIDVLNKYGLDNEGYYDSINQGISKSLFKRY